MSQEILPSRPSLYRKLVQTPLRDLLRGKVSGRLDWRGRIQSCALPLEAKALIMNVVKRTRLWKLERYQLADELIAHFIDGLEAGATVEQLVQSFGDQHTAANLMRRAKIRNRPLAWHAFKWARRGVLALLVYYAGLSVYYYTGKPTVSVDYLAKMNEPILAVPESHRAWPIYREALLAWVQDTMPDAYSPSDPNWQETVAWLRRSESVLQSVRTGAAQPALGRPLSLTIDPIDRAATVDMSGVYENLLWSSSLISQSVIAVRLPHLNKMRLFANALAADTHLALEERDAGRCEANIVAMLRLARQLTHQDLFVSDLVAVGIRALALNTFSDILHRDASVLPSEALKRLAHELSDVSRSSDLISYTGERYAFYDVVQRIYTDNGQGDGRFTPEGLRALGRWQIAPTIRSVNDPIEPIYRQPLELALGPASLLVTASRRELLVEYDRMMDSQAARLRYNLRDIVARRVPIEDSEEHFRRLRGGALTSVRYSLLSIMAPSFDRASVTTERTLGMQEGLQVAIALELYRRANGSYPAALVDLTPRYLPRLPADRIDGQPLRYVLKDGKPLIYSVGVDRDDDGGQPPLRNGEPDPGRAAEWTTPQGAKVPDGDWILYPVP